MDYYKQVADCTKKLEKTIRQSQQPIKKEHLYYFVLSEYGFSLKMMDKMLQTLEQIGVIKFNKDETIEAVI